MPRGLDQTCPEWDITCFAKKGNPWVWVEIESFISEQIRI